MRHTSTMAMVMGLAGAACGGWNNDVLHPAVLEGRLAAEVDHSQAWARLVLPEGSYDPTELPDGFLRSDVQADGSFRFEQVPAGVEGMTLLASTGLGYAVHQTMEPVYGGADHDPDTHPEYRRTIQPVAGATVTGLVTLEGASRGQPSTVGVVGLPAVVRTDDTGRFDLEGLPFGEYDLWAEHYGHMPGRTHVSLHAGQVTTASLHLLSEDGGSVELGGLCAPCSNGSECASGLCVPHDIDGLVENVCTKTCGTEDECGAGYECDGLDTGSGLCMPTSLSCEAVNSDGRSCGRDDDCGLGGALPEGLCVGGRCRLPCGEDTECASGSCDTVHDNGRDVQVCL